MDQVKIGKFIAERRKAVSLTQSQLAEKLYITDRAVSKWENGKSMPDSSIMLDLCKVLNITVNDLLCGEIIQEETYKESFEKTLINMVEQKQQNDKRLLKIEVIMSLISIISSLSLIFVASFFDMSTLARILIIVGSFILIFATCFTALWIEQIAGYYECAICHHKYIPTYKNVTLAPHVNRTRYMKCPKCHKRSWQKKVYNKE